MTENVPVLHSHWYGDA